MDIHKVLKLLPHRHPFVMVDRVLTFEPNTSIVCLKNVTINEPFFQGHFPENPVMPGVMILEALAQASGLLYMCSNGLQHNGRLVHYFAGIDKARFKKIVSPGDQLHLHANFIKEKRDIWKLDCVAKVDDEVACTAELMIVNKELEQ